ncbi:ferredoxin-thioredoxin reductase catalytic domain-containing protein [Desulfotalea psychrophila]|uniref:ferredoxin:thioredoxin reductase n=1 Tax=Desulfotalea psychrophila (strain LSv54 / DSM 12343) TaxID=177439 RepID=Q6AMG7_DESPS|nr:ferredoxin-thioredoxin reductase catalytic domain-containing protein [Desulfotalea psychrophila]CAG36458.1 conserved hypothetical protein [Desulfotalea psychrophila LSv54]
MVKVKLYALAKCSYSQSIKKIFSEFQVDYSCIEIDRLPVVELKQVLAAMRLLNSQVIFPIVVVGNQVIAGHNLQAIRDALGIRTEIAQLRDRLAVLAGKKGYCLNANREKTLRLLHALLLNRDRYGYMACPCRAASGRRERDLDIICPCLYRWADIAEYGSCYCGLYVAQEWDGVELEQIHVPERRVVECQ